MMNGLGFRFQPGQSMDLQGQKKPVQQGLQSPAQMLSLNLPNRQAPTSIAPQALLQGQGGQAASGGIASFLTMLSQLLAQQRQQPSATPMDAGQANPTQRINVPGLQAPEEAQTLRLPNVPQANQPLPVSATTQPTPRFTIGQQAGAGDELTPLF